MAWMASMSAGTPKTCTGRMAFVRGVMAAWMARGSILSVVGSMSTNTGVARSKRMQLADATKLKGVVITSSPGPMPRACTAR